MTFHQPLTTHFCLVSETLLQLIEILFVRFHYYQFSCRPDENIRAIKGQDFKYQISLVTIITCFQFFSLKLIFLSIIPLNKCFRKH